MNMLMMFKHHLRAARSPVRRTSLKRHVRMTERSSVHSPGPHLTWKQRGKAGKHKDRLQDRFAASSKDIIICLKELRSLGPKVVRHPCAPDLPIFEPRMPLFDLFSSQSI